MTLVSEASTLSTVMVAEPNPETVLENSSNYWARGTARNSVALTHLCVCAYKYMEAEVNIKCVP